MTRRKARASDHRTPVALDEERQRHERRSDLDRGSQPGSRRHACHRDDDDIGEQQHDDPRVDLAQVQASVRWAQTSAANPTHIQAREPLGASRAAPTSTAPEGESENDGGDGWRQPPQRRADQCPQRRVGVRQGCSKLVDVLPVQDVPARHASRPARPAAPPARTPATTRPRSSRSQDRAVVLASQRRARPRPEGTPHRCYTTLPHRLSRGPPGMPVSRLRAPA